MEKGSAAFGQTATFKAVMCDTILDSWKWVWFTSMHLVLVKKQTNKKQQQWTDQSKSSDNVLFAVHGQASQQLPLHTALVWQLSQGGLGVLSLSPLLSAADQEFFLSLKKVQNWRLSINVHKARTTCVLSHVIKIAFRKNKCIEKPKCPSWLPSYLQDEA